MSEPDDDAQFRESVTQLLRAWREGDQDAEARVLDIVHRELHRLARRAMQRERCARTLQPTALVNEAYLRLRAADIPWQDRGHFYAVAARSMRRILVDAARTRRRLKRGGAADPLALDALDPASPERPADVVALDEALDRLRELDARKARAVELHYFAGLAYEEIASILEISPATVHRDLRMARAWLHRELRR